jgi:hypothetical protein
MHNKIKFVDQNDLYTATEEIWTKAKEARANLIDKSEKGAASGVATLDANGKVPSS